MKKRLSIFAIPRAITITKFILVASWNIDQKYVGLRKGTIWNLHIMLHSLQNNIWNLRIFLYSFKHMEVFCFNFHFSWICLKLGIQIKIGIISMYARCFDKLTSSSSKYSSNHPNRSAGVCVYLCETYFQIVLDTAQGYHKSIHRLKQDIFIHLTLFIPYVHESQASYVGTVSMNKEAVNLFSCKL